MAAEEKKSPVVGGSRPGVLVGVLNTKVRFEPAGVGVMDRALMNGSSSKSWSSPSSSVVGGQFSLLAWSILPFEVSSSVCNLGWESEGVAESHFDLAC